jgi:putative nucleotidyltransferase with HDIG domain
LVDAVKTDGGRRVALLGVSVLLLGVTHFTVGTGTHPAHVVHVILGGLYLLPIIAGALWFGLGGGVAVSLAASHVYLAHILLSWPHRPMENVNQYATIGVYLLVGAVSGFLVERERRAQREVVIEGIASLSNALGSRDEYTREHSERVAHLAVRIGRRRGLSGRKLEVLRLASLMHDVGKIGIPDDILLKPRELTPDERARIERHPALAAEILRPILGAREIAEIVLSHHECPDGSGYPRGQVGDQIPLEARILRVADVYTALKDSRVYKPAMPTEEVMKRLGDLAGPKLDRESVRMLDQLVKEAVDGNSSASDPSNPNLTFEP